MTESVEVIQQTALRVLHGMVKDTDGPGVSAASHLLQYLEVFRPDADGQDLAAFRVAADIHAVEIQAEQMRQHELKDFVQPRQMPVPVMKIIDDADIGDGVVLLQVFTDRDHVLGLARPASMIIKGDLAADLRGLGDHGQQPFGRILHLGFLRVPLVAGHHPDLRMQLVLLEKGEGLVMRRPEGEELDAMLLIGEDLGLELGDMLLPPIIGDLGQAHLRHHRGPLLRRALLVVERDDAPSHQVLGLIDRLGPEAGETD